jgi:alcohol dehydrogenase
MGHDPDIRLPHVPGHELAGEVVAKELRIFGGHGMPAHAYPEMLRMIERGALQPQRLLGKRINLDESVDALIGMDSFAGVGVTVVDRFCAGCG